MYWTGRRSRARLFFRDDQRWRCRADLERLARVREALSHPGDLSDISDLQSASVSADKDVSDAHKHLTAAISGLLCFTSHSHIKEDQRKKKGPSLSHTFSPSLFIGVFSFSVLLWTTQAAGWGAFDLPCRASSMAHFHKSHVSVFVARATLTRGRSPNTEPMKSSQHAATEQLYGHIHQRAEEVGKFHVETARKCFVIWRAPMKEKVCVCVCLMCVCVLHFLKMDHMPSWRRANGFRPN